MQYKQTDLGTDENRISIILLEKTMEEGLCGMVSSPLFNENIGIVLADNTDDEYSFASLACGVDGAAPHIVMRLDLFEELRENKTVALTVLIHEIGHYFNSDHKSCENDDYARRLELASQNKICHKETAADEFAVKYLGKDNVISGLEILKERITGMMDAYDEEIVLLSIKEIDSRISYIKR